MHPKKIAFVDIETTGTSLRSDRILEIGIVRVENGKVVRKFQSLVNPQTYIPLEITRITGISSRDVENAPSFSSLAKEIRSLLEDCVFCAHNVRFDYGFVRRELAREELSFRAKNLCTIKLSRALFPKFKKHSLDSVVERLSLECEHRHRAFDDAWAIWQFYEKIHLLFSEEKIIKAVKKIMHQPSHPINLPEKFLDTLPERPGVYIFYGKEGTPLYVGKSVNIHSRVMSHFSADKDESKELRISQQVQSIETITTAGEVGALFKEADLIKKLQPLYNRQLRVARKMILLKSKPSQENNEYVGVVLEEATSIDPSDLENILGVFKSQKQAKEFLLEKCKEFELCEKLLGLEKTKNECFAYRLGKCKGACLKKESPAIYNSRFAIAFGNHKMRRWPFDGAIAITEVDEESDVWEQHIVDKWCYLGTIKSSDAFDEPIRFTKDFSFDLDTYKILNRFLKTPGAEKKIKSYTTDPKSLGGN